MNAFTGGIASIRVEDLLQPSLINVIDGGLAGNSVNSEAFSDADMLLQVGDLAMSTLYSTGFVFDQAVADMNGDGVITAADFVGVSASLTSMADLIFAVDIPGTAADPTGMTILFNATLNPFAPDVNPVAMGDVLTITGVTDLSANPAAVNTATLCTMAADGISILGVRTCP